jgi:hypothetical protein
MSQSDANLRNEQPGPEGPGGPLARLRGAFALDPMERLNLGFASGGLAASLAFGSPAFATSFALGAALEAVNFRALRACCTRLLAGELQGAGVWTALLGMRLSMLLVSMGIALVAGAHPLGLMLGVTTIVPAALLGAWWLRPAIDPDAPCLGPDDPSWDRWSVWRGGEVEPLEEEERA